MAIKRKVSQTYVTDRGIEIEVCNMQTAHLLNAIGHHYGQIRSLELLIRGMDPEPLYLRQRVELLDKTISILGNELAMRDPDKDYDDVPRPNDGRTEYMGDRYGR